MKYSSTLPTHILKVVLVGNEVLHRFFNTRLDKMSSFEFNEKTTAEEVVNTLGVSLEGKNVIITGASSGIGLECARVMVNAGANVFLANRNLEKSEPLVKNLQESCGNPDRVHLIKLDLSDLSSCRSAAAEFNALGIPLHILLNNGGVMAVQEKQLTKDGFEMQLGTNHFGHFVFTNALLEKLKAAGSSRVVNVSSMAHWRSPVLFDDIDFKDNYDPWKAYGQSKTANILFTKEFHKRFGSEGITCVVLHPGVIESELWRHSGKVVTFNKTIPQGASTSMFCCVAPNIEGGAYYNDCKLAEPAEYARNMDSAAKLWELSVERTQ